MDTSRAKDLIFMLHIQELEIINFNLCARHKLTAGYTTQGDVRLRLALDSINTDDVPLAAVQSFIGIQRAQPFISLNSASAFIGYRLFLKQNGVWLPSTSDMPRELFTPERWTVVEQDALISWTRENCHPLDLQVPDFLLKANDADTRVS